MKCCQHIKDHTQFFAELPRQSPGNPNCTRKILGAVRSDLPVRPRILDLGAGTGEQTQTLLQALPQAQIHAIDKNERFLEGLKARLQRTREEGERLQVSCADFTDLDLPAQAYDLIWSEGALYFVDLPQALTHFKQFLKPGGLVVFSSLTWLVDEPSREVAQYWQQHFPQMPTLTEQMNQLNTLGYDLLEVQVLPETIWWESYYDPIQEALKARAGETPLAHDDLERHLHAEIEMYAKYGAEYSYVYYALQLMV